MNELQVFNNDMFGQLRTIEENGKTYFCGNDVASALGYKRPSDAISAHCPPFGKTPWGLFNHQSVW